MQNIDTILTLDVYDYDLTPSTMKAIALDSNTRSVTAYITRNGQPYDVGQSDVTLTVIRPDGVGAQVTGEAYEYETSVEDTTVTRHGAYAELSQAALAVSGTLLAQFMFTSGEQILRTEIFTINVGKALDASTSTWAGEYQGYNLDELVQNVNESVAKVDAMEQDVSELKSGFNDLYNTAYVTDSANGSVAHFTDGADNIPMKSVKVNIAPVQSGSGDPSPSNVRAISGWDAVKVTRTGKNLLQYPYRSVDGTYQNVTRVTNSDGSVTFNGTASANSYFNFVTELDEIMLKAGTYILSANEVPQNALISVNVRVNGENKYNVNLTDTSNPVIFTPQEDGYLRCYVTVRSGAVINNWTVYPMLRLASDTDDTYESYDGNNYDVSLSSAGTVYGGTLDVVSGELTVDKKKVTIDGSTVQFTFASSNNTVAEYKNAIFGISSVDALQSATASAVPDMIADKATAISYNAAASKTAEKYGVTITDVGITTQTRVRVAIPKSQNVVTVAEANAWAANNPVTVVYPITNPLTYQLSETEIKSLLGINNVWSDAGDVEAEYRADTKLYIKRLTGSDTDMIADANIASGQYFMVGNDLYRATVNIASGAQIVVGTNATKVSLSEALNEINA